MILVAGVGNIFLGDDAFGTEVAARMKNKVLPTNVRVVDFGIRGVDLLYELLNDHYELVILLDAMQRGGRPGTLYVFEPEFSESGEWGGALDPHSMDPAEVLKAAENMGAQVGSYRIVGCEPASLDASEDGTIGLSEPIQSSVESAIEIVESLIKEAVR